MKLPEIFMRGNLHPMSLFQGDSLPGPSRQGRRVQLPLVPVENTYTKNWTLHNVDLVAVKATFT